MIPAHIVIILIGLWLGKILSQRFFVLFSCWGYLDLPNGRKHQSKPVPYGGGFVFFCSWCVWGAALVILELLGVFSLCFDQAQLVPAVLLSSVRSWGILFGFVSMLILGFLDDIFDLKPSLKLMVQLLVVSLSVVISDIGMTFFVAWPMLGSLVTILWIVLITNAFNLIDNMDGYAVVVALITLFGHAIVLLVNGQYLISFVCSMAIGPLMSFLAWNRPPAKMYMGDAGSLSLGYLIAVLSVVSTYYRDGQAEVAILTPLVMLAVPLFDVVTVMWIRYRTGSPLFLGDRRHFSHRLLDLGLSIREALAVIGLLTMICCAAAVLMQVLGGWGNLLVLFQVFMVLVLVSFLEMASKGKS